MQKVFFDITTKELSLGNIIEISNEDSTDFKKREECYIEVDYHVNKVHRQLRPCTIKEIEKGNLERQITGLGRNLEDCHHYIENPITNELYCLKFYKNSYIYGEIINWDHKLYKKQCDHIEKVKYQKKNILDCRRYDSTIINIYGLNLKERYGLNV